MVGPIDYLIIMSRLIAANLTKGDNNMDEIEIFNYLKTLPKEELFPSDGCYFVAQTPSGDCFYSGDFLSAPITWRNAWYSAYIFKYGEEKEKNDDEYPF